MPGLLSNITAGYSPLESWIFDRFVAPSTTPIFVDLLDGMVPELPVPPAKLRVVDVGCGGGHYVLALARKCPQLSFIGVDLSVEQIRRAERRRSEAGAGNVRFLEGDALHLPLESESADLVVSVGSLKHWPDARQGLAECVRILSRGGRMIIWECNPEASLDEVLIFVRVFCKPTFLQRPLARTFLERTARPSPSCGQLRAIARDLPLSTSVVETLAGSPFLRIIATK